MRAMAIGTSPALHDLPVPEPAPGEVRFDTGGVAERIRSLTDFTRGKLGKLAISIG
jgi:hypothetical protein